MSSNELLHVSDEFLKQNSKYIKTKKPSKKGGPYSQSDKEKRREEVYRLHFEYSYSARKIAELMKINRNTINSDISFWFSHILKDTEDSNPAVGIFVYLELMDNQLGRLRERLDKAKSVSEQISIERLILDIHSKIIHTYQKMAYSELQINKKVVEWVNQEMERANHPSRFISLLDTIRVSRKAHEKIMKIRKEDRT